MRKGAHLLVTLLAAVTRASFVSQDRVKLASYPGAAPGTEVPCKELLDSEPQPGCVTVLMKPFNPFLNAS